MIDLVERGDQEKCERPSAPKLTQANILLKADQPEDGFAYADATIAEALEVSPKTVFYIWQRWVEFGLEQARDRRPSKAPPKQPKLDGNAEAKLIACSCGPPPEGGSKWTLELRSDKVVEPGLADSICRETVRETLTKASPTPCLIQSWCPPKEYGAELVWRMEDVFDVYARQYDPRYPVICMDEASKQLAGGVRDPMPLRPGDPLGIDIEYVRPVHDLRTAARLATGSCDRSADQDSTP